MPQFHHSLIWSQRHFSTSFSTLERVFTRTSGTHAPHVWPDTIFSGIQPTGIPHLGNYLGAIQNWITLQGTSSFPASTSGTDTLRLYSIVGWHALTLPPDSSALLEAKFDTAASLLALGIDPQRSVLFHQDDVHEHLELCWILSCLAPMGWLKRMTTWKAKLSMSRNAKSEFEIDDTILNLGLFSYPVLQAADILAYRATYVPVGDDQKQHLELCRDLADAFNRRYSLTSTSKQNNVQFSTPLFPLPNAIYTTSSRILSLRDPSQKMSKSAPDPNSRIILSDTPDLIAKKVRMAVTDSAKKVTYDPEGRPGVANLLRVLAAFRGVVADNNVGGLEKLAEGYANKGTADLKKDVTEAIVEGWRQPREELMRIRKDRIYIQGVLEKGATKARELSRRTLNCVRDRIGLGSRP